MVHTNGTDEMNKVPFYKSPWMAAVFIAVTVGLALWMMLARVWPASVLIEWQAEWFDGRYYPKATFAVIWIGIVFLIFAAMALAGRVVEIIRGEIK